MRYGSTFINLLPNDIIPDRIYEIAGINDFVRYDHCLHYYKNVYTSWFGHYFSAVNPYLWFNYIIKIIKRD